MFSIGQAAGRIPPHTDASLPTTMPMPSENIVPQHAEGRSRPCPGSFDFRSYRPEALMRLMGGGNGAADRPGAPPAQGMVAPFTSISAQVERLMGSFLGRAPSSSSTSQADSPTGEMRLKPLPAALQSAFPKMPAWGMGLKLAGGAGLGLVLGKVLGSALTGGPGLIGVGMMGLGAAAGGLIGKQFGGTPGAFVGAGVGGMLGAQAGNVMLLSALVP